MSTSSVSLKTVTTLADVIVQIAGLTNLPPPHRGELASALRTFCRAVGRQPSAVIADTDRLRRDMGSLTPAAVGVSPGRLRNLKSLVDKAFRLTGVTTIARRTRLPQSDAWRTLLAAVKDRYDRSKLSRLAAYCSNRCLEPWHVDDAVLTAFGLDLARSTIPRPKQVHRNACVTWNLQVDQVPGWPPMRLTVPDNRRTYALPLKAFTPGFQRDVTNFLDYLARGDLFSEAVRDPASPSTIRDRGILILELATALVNSGRALNTIDSLADLVEVTSAKQALTYLWNRNGHRKTGQLNNFARVLVNIARNWVKVPDAALAQLRGLRKQVDPGKGGLTAKNKARLRPFDDPVNIENLVNLPARIAREMTRIKHPGYNDAIRMQSAVAIAIELAVPVRAKNLAALTFDRHIIRARSGSGAAVHLVVPQSEVKNRQALEFELPPDVVRLIDLYKNRFRHLLQTEPSSFLFPARGGGSKEPGPLGTQIKSLILKETGLVLNLHAFRHLCAFLFLKARPGDYETVRLLLGHKSLSTTVRFYCGLEQSDAFRRYDALLDQYRSKGTRRAD